MDYLKSHKDIKVAQFYRSYGSDYYYVGVIYGMLNERKLSCINLTTEFDLEIDDNNFLPDHYIPDWLLVECSQEEAMKCI